MAVSFRSEGVFTGTAGQGFVGGLRNNVIVGLEALVPRGGFAQYGLLELAFLPDDLDRLQLEVPYSSITGTAWPGALAGSLDEVRLGLPKEYAPAVLASLSSAVEGRIPSGVLRIVAAAHGLVGSSPRFFEKIARAAVELALLDGDEVPDDRLVSLLRGIIVN